jgi:hypothetical protein
MQDYLSVIEFVSLNIPLNGSLSLRGLEIHHPACRKAF